MNTFIVSQHQLVILQEAAKRAPWETGNLILAVCNEIAAQQVQTPQPEPEKSES